MTPPCTNGALGMLGKMWARNAAQTARHLGNRVLPRPTQATARPSPVRLAIDSKLRGCDLVKLRIGDLVSGGTCRHRATVIQQKTGRPVQLEIMGDARKSLLAWLERRRGSLNDFIFPSRIDYTGHLSTRQYARLLDEWVSTVGLDKRQNGTHSLRRPKASLIYKATGNLRAIQILLGHTNIEHTVRYRGVDVDDALTLFERTEL